MVFPLGKYNKVNERFLFYYRHYTLDVIYSTLVYENIELL